MRGGQLGQIASPDDLYHRPTTAFVGEFVGTMNRLPGRMVDANTVEVLGQRRPVAASGVCRDPRVTRSPSWSDRRRSASRRTDGDPASSWSVPSRAR